MASSTFPQIIEVDFGEGDFALVVELPTAPFGSSSFTTEDTSDDSRLILTDLVHTWNDLWPDMLERLQEEMEGYDVEQKLGVDEFIGCISRLDPDCYMGDKSDVHLRLEFEEAPLWDYFLKGKSIIHFQPVF